MPFISQFSWVNQNNQIDGCEFEFQILENSTSLKNRCWCIKLAKIKSAKITFSIQSPIFKIAKLKGFTVYTTLANSWRDWTVKVHCKTRSKWLMHTRRGFLVSGTHSSATECSKWYLLPVSYAYNAYGNAVINYYYYCCRFCWALQAILQSMTIFYTYFGNSYCMVVAC